MKRLLLLVLLAQNIWAGPPKKEEDFSFAMIRYGGESWEKNEEMINHHVRFCIPKFLRWLNKKDLIQSHEEVVLVDLSDDAIFKYPCLFMGGRYGFELTAKEKSQLKIHLERGGFLFLDDCGGKKERHEKQGSFSAQIHELLQTLLPEGQWQVLPLDHEIYRVPFQFTAGLPAFFGKEDVPLRNLGAGKGRKGRGGEGFFWRNHMVAFFSDADLSAMWVWGGGRDGGIPAQSSLLFDLPTVSMNDAVAREMSEELEQAYQIGANVIIYATTH